LTGVRGKLRIGSDVSLARLDGGRTISNRPGRRRKYPACGPDRLAAIDPETSLWNDIIETHSEAALAP
jgi:hypothetical protein